ncbi:hypothetical protein TNCV_4328761 [Trichonephila clavipes]|nr:hypothetical protein TNCV_4328761 [Trichonephila clavipes]
MVGGLEFRSPKHETFDGGRGSLVVKPLFLYLSHLAVHAANKYMPLQAPLDLVNQFDYIKNQPRRAFADFYTAGHTKSNTLKEACKACEIYIMRWWR